MVISHVQSFFLSLLVSLFFLPAALGVTDFHNCNPLRNYPLKSRLWRYLHTRRLALIRAFPEPISKRSYSLCDIVACPVAAGPIVLNLFNVFTQQELIPWGYFVSISITEEHREDPMMCVSFRCRITRQETSLL
ncbi:hypothetical protein N665_0227s0008 [Sinapis alba]|nr:hypothetical protein N665_0227s0008 [Sinapis alba]